MKKQNGENRDGVLPVADSTAEGVGGAGSGSSGNDGGGSGKGGGNSAGTRNGADTVRDGDGKGGTNGGADTVRDGDGSDGNGRGRGRKMSGGFNRPSRRRTRKPQKSEFDSRVLSARRVSRVVAGGRRFSLSVAVAVGNGNGRVGIGVSKGQDMATAMDKARYQAQKNVVQIPLTDDKGIPHEAVGKYCASVVHLRPAKGFVAGGAVRTVAELAGIQRLNAKIQSRSKSHLNNARAVMRAFSLMKQ